MGWFDEQIKQRKLNDNEVFEETFIQIAGSVLGRSVSAAFKKDSQISKDAIAEILRVCKIKPAEIPDNITDINDQLDYLMRPYGFMRRVVKLEKGWHKDSAGVMLGVFKESGNVVALIPSGMSGYTYYDAKSDKRIRINSENEGLFETEAILFYIPFPNQKLTLKDLCAYVINLFSISDLILLLVSSLAVSLVGLLIPKINNLLMGPVLESGSISVLIGIAIFMICVGISSLMFTAFNSLVSLCINTKLSVAVEAATMMRVLSLPADFFRKYNSGELSNRISLVNSLCNMLVNSLFKVGITSIFSLIYITSIFKYAPSLVVPAMTVIIVTFVFSIVSSLVQMKVSRNLMELQGKEEGVKYSLLSGIQKIKLSGAEKRAFAKWGLQYSKVAELTYNPPMIIKVNSVITLFITLFGTFMMYYFAVKSHVSVSDYFSFNVAYGMVSGAFFELSGIALTVAQIKPIIEMVKPILETVPEVSENKKVVTRLSGGVELNNVKFRYNENMPYILDDISLKIKPGQYVAIVGKTGCGKSTLVRLLLGFEKPQNGAIYYDGKDVNSLDLQSLRQKIGVVMQEGNLFQGDIFSNIAISAPMLTQNEAWEVAELAGIKEDIEKMPMGMFTCISEGGGGVSGGQRQRLMIARALAPKPKILIFDEATSALDNITQKKVSESLDNLNCTRIVIAHRLSTIRQCDRIVVLDGGKIIEDGTYEELIEQDGFFAELVARQRVE